MTSLLLASAAFSGHPTITTTAYSLDKGWRFALEGAGPLVPCKAGTWTKKLNDQQTMGLTQAAAITEETCAAECCADMTCETYQYCNSSTCGSGPPQQAS